MLYRAFPTYILFSPPSSFLRIVKMPSTTNIVDGGKGPCWLVTDPGYWIMRVSVHPCTLHFLSASDIQHTVCSRTWV